MWISRADEIENVRDSVQVNNPLKTKNNFQGMQSPLTANFHAMRKMGAAQNVANSAGVVVSISGGNKKYSSQSNMMSLSNIDMDLFAAD